MIRWLVQTVADHPDLAENRPPSGLLTRAELTRYAAFLSPRRRRDWLLGRWTAKRLIQAHIAATDGFTPTLDSFSITYLPSGAPAIEQVPLALAISHSHGYAFCALSKNHLGHVQIGSDIELVESQPVDFIEEFFTPAEAAHVNAAPPVLRDVLITTTWSVKEATLKASHLGLRVDPRSVECIVPHARPRHWMPLRVTIQCEARAQSGTVGPLRVWWRVIDNRLRPGTTFVLTLAAYGATL